MPDISAIYISDGIAEGRTIDYVYRVYIEYESRWGTDAVLFMVDDKDRTYFTTAYGKEELVAYLTVAEVEIFGIEGFFGPGDEWEELSSSEIRKIEKNLIRKIC